MSTTHATTRWRLRHGAAILLVLVSVVCGCGDDFVPNRTPSGVFYIDSQSDLNALAGVQSISGSVFIEKRLNIDESDPVVDLSPLSDLKSVTGSLRIDDKDTIETLVPLSSLRSVGSNLYIGHNDNIQTLVPLQRLTHVGLVFFVQDNDRLKDLDGLQRMDLENGADLQDSLNDSLASLHGLENISVVTGRAGQRFVFERNDQLCSLGGLNSKIEFARYSRRTMVLSEVSCGVRWSTRGGGLPRREGVHSDGSDLASTAGAGATGGASI